MFTIRGRPGELAERVLAGAREAVGRVDLRAHQGVHPRVGAVDVAPIVYLDPAQRGAAVAEALILADRLGTELKLPVYLYGVLAGGRTRAELRKGGPEALIARTPPDAGPGELHPTAGGHGTPLASARSMSLRTRQRMGLVRSRSERSRELSALPTRSHRQP